MLVVLAIGPVATPVEACLGEKFEAEVVVSGVVLLSLLPHDVSTFVPQKTMVSTNGRVAASTQFFIFELFLVVCYIFCLIPAVAF